VRALADAGVVVDDIGLRRPTLDDVFLELTGRRADAGDAPGGGDPPEGEPTDPGGDGDGHGNTVAATRPESAGAAA
jgi:ABC-2 type transport system ATP-binding protein